jgi:hypothetical protein
MNDVIGRIDQLFANANYRGGSSIVREQLHVEVSRALVDCGRTVEARVTPNSRAQDTVDDVEGEPAPFMPGRNHRDLRLTSDWRKIETAPKDFTPVLLWWVPENGSAPGVVLERWYCRTHALMARRHDCPNEQDCQMGWGCYSEKMTHWLPLPAPPQEKKQEDLLTRGDGERLTDQPRTASQPEVK